MSFYRLYGIMVVQIYVYILKCSKDPRWTKTLVVAVWSVMSVRQASETRAEKNPKYVLIYIVCLKQCI